MESEYNKKIYTEDLLREFFPDSKSISPITNNKYFLIDFKKDENISESNSHNTKRKLTKTEWFESLDFDQRIEAISTIATDNMLLINNIKCDLK